MGLFSSSNKNKQDRAAQDSGRFYSKDDDAAVGERARAKRASNAGGAGGATRRPGNDPLLPEKKRARRRLVGAIALALAAAVGLPMLLDSEPKPLAGDIAIQIPSKDKAAPLPVPGDAPDARGDAKSVAAKDSVDQGEEVVSAPPPAPAPALQKPAPAPAVVAAAKPAEPKAEAPKPERKPEPVKSDVAKSEHKDAKPEHKEAEHKDKPEQRVADKAEKPEKPVKPKAEDKPAKSHEDAARALAILEDKSDKADKADKSESSQRFVLQVVAMSTQEKAAEVQARLREAGISSHTEKATTAAGELIRVKVGPLSRDDADKVRAKLAKLGFSGKMSPL